MPRNWLHRTTRLQCQEYANWLKRFQRTHDSLKILLGDNLAQLPYFSSAISKKMIMMMSKYFGTREQLFICILIYFLAVLVLPTRLWLHSNRLTLFKTKLNFKRFLRSAGESTAHDVILVHIFGYSSCIRRPDI